MTTLHDETLREDASRVAAVLSVLLSTVGALLYAVLSLLEPLVVWTLSAAMIVSLGLIGFFTLLVPASHFPVSVAVALILACAATLVLYYGLLGWLSGED